MWMKASFAGILDILTSLPMMQMDTAFISTGTITVAPFTAIDPCLAEALIAKTTKDGRCGMTMTAKS
jgi:hypothetical protein